MATGECYCGCGEAPREAGSTWVSGHDATMSEWVMRQVFGSRRDFVDAHPKIRDAYRQKVGESRPGV